MQAIFKEIVDGEEQKVRDRIAKTPSQVEAVAAGQPKQYAGQSTLQVAVRTGQFAIAGFLLENGADPNFADTESPSGWSKSVLHDAAVAAVMRSRWVRMTINAKSEKEWSLRNSGSSAEEAFSTLVALLDAGAVVDAVDSKGATPLGRAAHAAHDILPRRRDDESERTDDRPLNAELVDDLTRIFDLLLSRGADPSRVEPQLDMTLAQYYAGRLVGKFLAGEAPRPDA